MKQPVRKSGPFFSEGDCARGPEGAGGGRWTEEETTKGSGWSA